MTLVLYTGVYTKGILYQTQYFLTGLNDLGFVNATETLRLQIVLSYWENNTLRFFH